MKNDPLVVVVVVRKSFRFRIQFCTAKDIVSICLYSGLSLCIPITKTSYSLDLLKLSYLKKEKKESKVALVSMLLIVGHHWFLRSNFLFVKLSAEVDN